MPQRYASTSTAGGHARQSHRRAGSNANASNTSSYYGEMSAFNVRATGGSAQYQRFSGTSESSSLLRAFPGGNGASAGATTTTTTSGTTMTAVAVAAVPAADEFDDEREFRLQLLAYRGIYVIQGAFMGLLGPSLVYFSALARETSQLDAPIYGFGPIFAAHGGAALVTSFMSELVLRVAIERSFIKQLVVALLVCSGGWYACLAPVAAATGNLGVGIYFIAKGGWTALLNISYVCGVAFYVCYSVDAHTRLCRLNRCCLWIAGDKIERGRSLVTSMNLHYGLGTFIGAMSAMCLMALGWDFGWAFIALAGVTVVPIIMIATLPCPRSYYGRDEHQPLLAFEDPTRRVPTVPSPIVGGVFLHVKHIGHSANCNPDTYDAKNNFIILLVTIFATVLFGVQLGLAAFFYDYIGHVLSVQEQTKLLDSSASSSQESSEADRALWQCMLMALFYGALTASYAFFSKFMFHALNLYSIFFLSVVTLVSSFGIMFGAETGVAAFAVCTALFAVALAPLFTLSIHCLTRVINEQLIRRVSSLIVFGCGMGEIFIPVLMGFFMSGQSGQTNGSVAVSAITFLLSMTLVGVSGMLLWMVKVRLEELAKEPVDPRAALAATGRGHLVANTPPSGRYQPQQYQQHKQHRGSASALGNGNGNGNARGHGKKSSARY